MRRKHKQHEPNYWMSYSDLMAAMLMVFALLLSVVILDYRELLEQKEKQIEEVVKVKTEIIKELTKAFEESDLEIEIDQDTGAIRFPGRVLFEYNSSSLSTQGKTFLEEFIPAYMDILLQERFRDDISSIIVEGHTDSKGGYVYNMNLSQQRAFSVVDYIFTNEINNFNHKELSKSFITANGRSYSKPLYDENGEYNPDRSRRVEFLFRLKEDEMIQEINKLVQEQ